MDDSSYFRFDDDNKTKQYVYEGVCNEQSWRKFPVDWLTYTLTQLLEFKIIWSISIKILILIANNPVVGVPIL